MEAYQILRVLSPGQSVVSALQDTALVGLNRVNQDLQNRGNRVWKTEWRAIACSAPAVASVGSVNYVCIRSHSASDGTAPGSGSIWPMFWLSTAWASACSLWVSNQYYSAAGDWQLGGNCINVLSAYLRIDEITDEDVQTVTMRDYLAESQKWEDGEPIRLAVERLKNPRIYLYPQPDFDNWDRYIVHFLGEYYLEDFDAAGNDADATAKWMNFYVPMLCYYLAPKFHISLEERMVFKDEAAEAYKRATGKDWDMPTFTFVESCY
jgi:hypothetical protein